MRFTQVVATDTPLPVATETSVPSFHLCSPLNGFPRDKLDKIISDGYKPPPPGSDDRHQGVDFVFHRQAGEQRNILGVSVQAVLFGTVAAAVHDSFPYGNLVIIETPYWHLPKDLVEELGIEPTESLYHLYGHLQGDLRVELGQRVTCCQVIGTVGASGNTEAPHLHLETRIGPIGQLFPVMSAFSDGVTGEQRANYVLWRTSMVFQHFDPMRLMGYGLNE
jgi:murein DD-endopeptidase MepM/ murein hydrolase activator NlpD